MGEEPQQLHNSLKGSFLKIKPYALLFSFYKNWTNIAQHKYVKSDGK